MGNKQNVWNSEKGCFESVDVYEGVMAEYNRQEKAAQPSVQRTAKQPCPKCGSLHNLGWRSCKNCGYRRR